MAMKRSFARLRLASPMPGQTTKTGLRYTYMSIDFIVFLLFRITPVCSRYSRFANGLCALKRREKGIHLYNKNTASTIKMDFGAAVALRHGGAERPAGHDSGAGIPWLYE